MRTRYLTMTALAALFTLTLLGVKPAVAGVKLEVAPDYFVTLSYLLQPQMQINHDLGADATTNDWYIRRSRIILGGQVSEWVSFFMETDSPNWGRGGNFNANTSFFVQDAWVKFNLHEAFNVHMGMILPPFVRHFRQSAVSLNTLDYHGTLNQYPGGMVWRDLGIEFGGLLFNERIDYRLSVANGGWGDGLTEIPRFTGRIGYNFLDSEPGYFFGGTYLRSKRIFSVGVAFDVQPDILAGVTDPAGNPATDMYFAVGADVAWDLPFVGGNRLSGSANFVYYGDEDYINAGMGIMFDIGYAIGKWQPLLLANWFKPERADDFDDHFLRLGAGLNYWLHGHNANIKLEVAMVKNPTVEFSDSQIVTTLQTQLFF